LAGLLSIATGNRAGHSAVAAGTESFGYGMLEAAACLAEDGRPTLLMHFDEGLPESHGEIAGPREAATAVAVLLAPADADDGLPVTLEMLPAEQPGDDPLALTFISMLSETAFHGEAAGCRMIWRWRRAA
jgi:hypothetical protein